MKYESSVGLGTLPVFYTGEFPQTIPGVFQLLYVFPFLLNPVVLLFSLGAVVYGVWKVQSERSLLLLLSFFAILFLSQGVLFVKWTRYMIPTLPFLYILLAWFITSQKRLKSLSVVILILASVIWGSSYFITAFVEPDTRIEAAHVAKKMIPSLSPILSEVYDLGIVPFNETHPNIRLFNTYELDNNNPEYSLESLKEARASTEYIILPSQRVLKTRLHHPKLYPKGYLFYSGLANQTLGFQKIYQTPCSIFCQITYLGEPVNRYEETANVFDRPTLFMYKKL